MHPQSYKKFCLKSTKTSKIPHIGDTYRTLNRNLEEIEEETMPTEPGREKDNYGLDATMYQTGHGERSTGFRRINKPDTGATSTSNYQERRENGIEPGVTKITKLALSLGTIEQLTERLEDAEAHAKVAETRVFEAKLVESNTKVKGESVESTFNTILNSIRRRQVNEHQTHFRSQRRQASFKARWPMVKEEVINLLLEHKHKEQEITQRCMELCKQKTNNLVKQRETRERHVAIFRWCLAYRQLIKDFEKGMFEADVDELLSNY